MFHKCPEEICRRIASGTEAEKAKARSAAVEWLQKQRVQMGDTVWMPDAQTGQLISLKQMMQPTPFGRA